MSQTKGRPPSDNPKDKRLELRVTQSQKEEIQSFMKESGLSLLDLIQKGIKAAKEEE